MKFRFKAKNDRGSREYYIEPYTMQHYTDYLRQLVTDLWHTAQLVFSKRKRMEMARAYNRALFGDIPTEQITVFDEDGPRPLRPEERAWPE